MKKVLFIFGTRPEVIKLAPLIKELKKQPRYFDIKLCVTAQHRQMLDQEMRFFNLKPDYDLNLMKPNQTLFDITSRCLLGIEPVLDDFKPDFIFVQGDTTSSLVGMIGALYKKIKILHVEAGLRSGNKYSPFPEEMNRVLVSHLSDYHFAPTLQAVRNLKKEGITEHVYMVGNTVVDALFLGLKIISQSENLKINIEKYFNFLDISKKIILVTGHRRENFGKPIQQICIALKKIAKKFPEIEIVFPVHPNPNVLIPVREQLGKIKNIHLIPPLDYPYLIWLMGKSFFIITDSGGIQEEAPSLGKPILVTRLVTERTEGVRAGLARLVGSSSLAIIKEASALLNNKKHYSRMSRVTHLYGDGKASKKITEVVKKIKI